MEWIDVKNDKIEIPFTKVCIWDGANTFWAYLQKVELTNNGRKLYWNVITPEGYGDFTPLYWIKITEPKTN